MIGMTGIRNFSCKECKKSVYLKFGFRMNYTNKPVYYCSNCGTGYKANIVSPKDIQKKVDNDTAIIKKARAWND